MRELKFRVWHEERYEMFSFELSGLAGWDEGNVFILGNEKSDLWICDEGKYNPDLEYMQYTGLKDVNGTEIYEDDTIEYEFDDGSTRGIVRFRNGTFWLDSIGKVGICKPLGTIHSSDLQILGNIHENPELMAGA